MVDGHLLSNSLVMVRERSRSGLKKPTPIVGNKTVVKVKVTPLLTQPSTPIIALQDFVTLCINLNSTKPLL